MKREVCGNRRTFLKMAAFFSGFAALLTLGKPAGFASPKKPVPQPTSGQGYRLTEHIRKYYETARM
jgi:hypothetical protein